MPTTNKRINLTVPAPLYEKIQEFKAEQGITSDASACIQLINQQLRGLENMKTMFGLMSKLNNDQLMQLTQEGYDTLREEGILPKEE